MKIKYGNRLFFFYLDPIISYNNKNCLFYINKLHNKLSSSGSKKEIDRELTDKPAGSITLMHNRQSDNSIRWQEIDKIYNWNKRTKSQTTPLILCYLCLPIFWCFNLIGLCLFGN